MSLQCDYCKRNVKRLVKLCDIPELRKIFDRLTDEDSVCVICTKKAKVIADKIPKRKLYEAYLQKKKLKEEKEKKRKDGLSKPVNVQESKAKKSYNDIHDDNIIKPTNNSYGIILENAFCISQNTYENIVSNGCLTDEFKKRINLQLQKKYATVTDTHIPTVDSKIESPLDVTSKQYSEKLNNTLSNNYKLHDETLEKDSELDKEAVIATTSKSSSFESNIFSTWKTIRKINASHSSEHKIKTKKHINRPHIQRKLNKLPDETTLKNNDVKRKKYYGNSEIAELTSRNLKKFSLLMKKNGTSYMEDSLLRYYNSAKLDSPENDPSRMDTEDYNIVETTIDDIDRLQENSVEEQEVASAIDQLMVGMHVMCNTDENDSITKQVCANKLETFSSQKLNVDKIPEKEKSNEAQINNIKDVNVKSVETPLVPLVKVDKNYSLSKNTDCFISNDQNTNMNEIDDNILSNISIPLTIEQNVNNICEKELTVCQVSDLEAPWKTELECIDTKAISENLVSDNHNKIDNASDYRDGHNDVTKVGTDAKQDQFIENTESQIPPTDQNPDAIQENINKSLANDMNISQANVINKIALNSLNNQNLNNCTSYSVGLLHAEKPSSPNFMTRIGPLPELSIKRVHWSFECDAVLESGVRHRCYKTVNSFATPVCRERDCRTGNLLFNFTALLNTGHQRIELNGQEAHRTMFGVSRRVWTDVLCLLYSLGEYAYHPGKIDRSRQPLQATVLDLIVRSAPKVRNLMLLYQKVNCPNGVKLRSIDAVQSHDVLRSDDGNDAVLLGLEPKTLSLMRTSAGLHADVVRLNKKATMYKLDIEDLKSRLENSDEINADDRSLFSQKIAAFECDLESCKIDLAKSIKAEHLHRNKYL